MHHRARAGRPASLPLMLAVSALALVTAATAWATPVTFRYQPLIGGVSSVAVAGSFNGWDKAANAMKSDADGRWETTVDIPAGRITYKFVVNGDQWITDDNAAESEDDGFGGKNAVLVVADKPLVVGSGAPVVKKKAAAPAGLRQVTFQYKPDGTPSRVHLAGAFNDWSTDKTPLSGPDASGVWKVTLLLPTGSYMYKFVVDGTNWKQDTAGEDANADDGYGGKNSIRNVDDRFPALAVKRGDGKIHEDGLGFGRGSGEVNSMGGGRVEFTIKTHVDDVEGADFVTWAGGTEKSEPMRAVDADRAYQYWRVSTTMPAGETTFGFRLHDGATRKWLAGDGIAADRSTFTFSAEKYPAFETPDWVKHGIIYQIFPDRFRNGDTKNDPDFSEWYYAGRHTAPAAGQKLDLKYQEYYHRTAWDDFAALTHNPYTADGRDWMAFYGGDIAGVREKLDYLKQLNVSAIYFNPLFEAKSTHKYDATDFKKIDPHFGSNDSFRAFVKEAHARGIRVILDIVYNHTGNTNWAFKDAVDKGTQSATYDWYEFKQWPLPTGWPNVTSPWEPKNYYDCWWGFGDLPNLNYDLSRPQAAENGVTDVKDAQPNIALVKYLLDTTEYWLKDMDCDGVRLDVANEVPFWFWKLFHTRVKQAKADAYIVGELWGNAQDYVRPDRFDAVMNYAFHYFPVERFLCKGEGNAAEFDATLSTGRLAYPRQAVEAQMNLISSHDKARYVSRAGGDLARLKLAALFQMTYVGAPTIYYGDEVALAGGEDPDNRRPFPWDWEKDPKRVDVHDWYVKLSNLRTAHRALRDGEFKTLTAESKVFAYARSNADETFVVALNAGNAQATAELNLTAWGGAVKATDALSGAAESWSGTARVALAPESGRVWRIERGAGKAQAVVKPVARPTAKPVAKTVAKPVARKPAKAGARK